MKSIVALIVALCAFVPGYSSAGVIYEWTGTNQNTPKTVTLMMEFDAETVASGAFSLQLRPRDPGETYHSGLINFRYSGGGVGVDIGRDNFHRFGQLNMNFAFESGGSLSGSFYINTSSDEVAMGGTRGFWSLSLLSSDNPSIQYCGRSYAPCDAHGYVRRTDIPEPASIALLGIGLAGVAGLRRRKQR